MEASFPLLFAAAVGFGHAFEADHLVAVGNIVTKRNQLKLALKDGVYWGLGHTSTIFLIGCIMILGKATFLNGYFSYLEAVVGLMLIGLGVYRLYEYYDEREETALHRQQHKNGEAHHHLGQVAEAGNHRLAYGIGLIHGLAGSGAMILMVMAEVESTLSSLLYLLIFGIGSAIGMLVAAGIFSLPFSKKIAEDDNVYFGLVLLSSVLCIGFGVYVVLENLITLA